MNRGTVVFLTLVLLVTHTLAIYQDPAGNFAPPYENAHVAYRLGRNLVHAGAARWDPALPPADSYPSLAWIGLSALAARLNWAPTALAQATGFAAVLGALVLLAQFSARRMAGLIAPLLLAASGSVAASAASGMETPVLLFGLTAAFLAFERGWRRPFAFFAASLPFVSPAGWILVLGFGLLERFDRPQRRRKSAAMRGAFALPLASIAGAALLRQAVAGDPVSAFDRLLFSFEASQLRLGLEYLWSFAIASGYLLVLPIPLIAALTGTLSPTARRATWILLAGGLVVGLTGGDGLPFWNALTPYLPLFFLAVQESLRVGMDARPRLAGPAWALLSVTVGACLLASKLPGDLGPLRLEGLLNRWMSPTTRLEQAYERKLGRPGLLDEIREVRNLRPLGIFLRDKVLADASILTFWPGAIGYLSRKDVIDALGRATPPPGERRTHSWCGQPRVDLIGAVQARPDYIVPLVGGLAAEASPTEFLRDWLRRWDVVGEQEERLHALIDALRPYELIAVPVPADEERPEVPSERPFLLLRNRDLHLGPRLSIEFTPTGFRVLVRHRGHRQVVDLYVVRLDRDGTAWTLRPTGEWVRGRTVAARTSLLMHSTGSRRIEAISARLPEGAEVAAISASLHNPGLVPGVAFSGIGTPVSARPPAR